MLSPFFTFTLVVLYKSHNQLSVIFQFIGENGSTVSNNFLIVFNSDFLVGVIYLPRFALTLLLFILSGHVHLVNLLINEMNKDLLTRDCKFADLPFSLVDHSISHHIHPSPTYHQQWYASSYGLSLGILSHKVIFHNINFPCSPL